MQNNHKGKECPNEKCYLCKRKGHKASLCPLKKKNQDKLKNKNYAKNIKKCTKCLNNGHDSKDCLIKPNDIIIVNPSKTPLCPICNSSSHYLCSFSNEVYTISDYDSDNINLDESDENDKNIENNKINNYIKNFNINRDNFNSLVQYFLNEGKKYEKIEIVLGKISGGIAKEEIKNTMFCCKCGRIHNCSDCWKHISKKKYINDDLSDEYYIKLNNFNNFIHKKNPLKFEPFEKSEYKINHHDMRYDYYDQDDSSGESFKEMYNKKNK